MGLWKSMKTINEVGDFLEKQESIFKGFVKNIVLKYILGEEKYEQRRKLIAKIEKNVRRDV